jgi:hypothetical protein
MGKHVHAEVIKAWADGAEVQVFRHEYDGYYWEDTATPSFNTDFEYRVKPADKIAEKEPIGFMDFGDPKNWKEFKNDTWGNSIKGEKHMKDTEMFHLRKQEAIQALARLSMASDEWLAETIAVAAAWQTDKEGRFIGVGIDPDLAIHIARFILEVQEEKNNE